eukprot:682258-Amphidinium_carterae.1
MAPTFEGLCKNIQAITDACAVHGLHFNVAKFSLAANKATRADSTQKFIAGIPLIPSSSMRLLGVTVDMNSNTG